MRHLAWTLLGLLGSALLAAAPAGAEVRIGVAAPLTGANAWAGAATERGVEVAVADINARSGVLGEQVEIITADDYCEGAQAVAAADKLVATQVVAALGHQCSGAAIPASKVYADAGILMISNLRHQSEADRAGTHQRVSHGRPG